MFEKKEFLTEQIITYIGNKRSLLKFIGEAVEAVKLELNKSKLDIVDLFSGSGIVSRYLKKDSNILITNDLEDYSLTINKCYLANKSEINFQEITKYYEYLIEKLDNNLEEGFISRLYAPRDSNYIIEGERVFFTTRNANYIDSCRKLIETFPKELKPFYIAPLLSEVSVKNNTAGVFKGFYKNKKGIGQFGGEKQNALNRIMADIELPFPIFSNFECKIFNFQKDANDLIDELPRLDIAYIDPPYNQHPYGSNYFMLNVINNYKEPKVISKVSGIPDDWNRSSYNKRKEVLDSFEDLCKKTKANYLLISYNSEGFIKREEMINVLSKIGKVSDFKKTYNVYRASRNLKNRTKHLEEYLYIVRK